VRFRRWLASKLYPEIHDWHNRYCWLLSEVQQAHRWLGEFKDADTVLHWLLLRNGDHWRKLDEPARSPYPADISGFREYLRSRLHPSSSTEPPSSGEAKGRE
jgi:hypothetical protein